MTVNVSMEIPCTERTSTEAHHHISAWCTCPDWVRYGIISVWHWKAATGLKILMGRHHLIELGQKRADEDKLISEATYELPSLLPVTDPKLKAI